MRESILQPNIPFAYRLFNEFFKLIKGNAKIKPIFTEHNRTPFSDNPSKLRKYKNITQKIAQQGFRENGAWLSLTVSAKIDQMKNLKDEQGKSAYAYIFDAAKIFGIKPSALLSIVMCENSKLDLNFENRRNNKDSDKGLMQISDENRLSLNQPAVAQKLASLLGQKQLEELGRLFGLEYSGGSLERFASRIVEKITGYNSFSGQLSSDTAFKLKHNIFAAAIYFFVNLKDYENNYILAAFAYHTGRRRLNNFLEGKKTSNPSRQKEAEENGINYASKFWNYFCVFESYFATQNQLFSASKSLFESVNRF
ncbi:MAG: hypothetical protein QXN37_00185 [Candidatus Anstonellaceae archaeon]